MRSITAALFLAACTRPQAPPPAIDFAGCREVIQGPVCVDPEARITVWTKTPGLPDAVPVAGGWRARLDASGDAAEARIAGHAPWRLRLSRGTPAPVRDAVSLHAQGRDANRAGRPVDALRTLATAQREQAATGWLSGAVESAQLQAFIHLARRDFPAARAALARAPEPAPGDAATHAMTAYVEALVDRAAGDLRGATRRFDAAWDLTLRLDLPLAHVVREQRATTLLEMGRAPEAVAALEALRSEDLPPCIRAALLDNLGWARLQSGDAGAPKTGEVLAAAREAYDRDCPEAPPHRRANARINLALHALRAGRPDEARRWHRSATRFTTIPEVERWAAYVEARLLGSRGAPALARLRERARAADLPGLAWRAQVARAELLEDLGSNDAAIAAYRRAESELSGQVLAIPVDAGRGGFLLDRSRSARRLVALLVRLGRPAEALAAARRSRRRTLTTLPAPDRIARLSPDGRRRWEQAYARYRQARDAAEADLTDAWRQSAASREAGREIRRGQQRALRRLRDEALSVLSDSSPSLAADADLRPLEAGELLLAWHRVPDGWMGFAATTAGVLAAPVEAGAWTTPFTDALSRAVRVRALADATVLADGLEVGDRPVVYALDLPPRTPPHGGGGDPLVVADPTGDLPQSRREAAEVAAHLGPRVHRIIGPAATPETVRAALARASLFHYAGHGRFGGREGWDSALPLRDGQLSVGDVLLLPAVPQTVVLSGCETGRADAGPAGVGLAHAFLLRGAQRVVASVRPVRDADALRFSTTLYEADDDLEPAFRRAAAGPGGDAYRLFVP